MSDTHPSLAELAAFDRGQLDEATLVEDHVAHCNACCQMLEQIRDDAFVELVRKAAAPSGRDTHPGRSADTPTGGSFWAGPDVPAELARHPRYRILGYLGGGGMGSVFKAEHRLMERTVALKVLNRSLVDRPGLVERFRQEVKAAARLNHRHIVRAHDADQAGDVHFLVMEYAEGVNLEHWVAEHPPLAVPVACDWIRQAALGLHHAFEHGMVHRDIKPANLLLCGNEIKILDFGLARFASESGPVGALTQPGMLIGTPDYMAPEQGLDPTRADSRADIYSLGCTLYFLLTGRVLFSEGPVLQKLMAHQQRQPKPVTDYRPDVPPKLAAILERMLAKDPAERFQTPIEVARALAGVTAQTVREPSKSSPRRLVALAVLVGLLLAVGMAAYVVWTREEEEVPSPPVAEGPAQPSVSTRPAPPPPDTQPVPPVQKASEEIRRISGAPPFTAVSFLADGRRALVAGPEFNLSMVDLDSAKGLARYPGHTAEVMSVAISADGRRAISGSKDLTVRVWDLEKRVLLHTLKEHSSWVRSVSFTADGRHALSSGNDGKVVLWDIEEGQAKRIFEAHPAMVSCVTAGRQSAHALTASSDRTLRIWNGLLDPGPQAPVPLYTYRGHDDSVLTATYSQNMRYLLSGSADGTARFWRAIPATPLAKLEGHTAPVTAVALNPDARYAVTGSADRTVRLWHLASKKQILRLDGHRDEIVQVAFLSDRQVISAGRDGTIRTWEIPRLFRSDLLFTGPDSNLPGVALTGDARRLAFACADHTVRIHDVPLRQELAVLKGHQDVVRCVALSSDGRVIVSSGDDRTIRFWDPTTYEELSVLTDHTAAVPALKLTRDGRTLVSGSADQTVKVWDLSGWKPGAGKPPARSFPRQDAVSAVAISVDGKLIASGIRARDDKDRPLTSPIHVQDAVTGETRIVLNGHQGTVHDLEFSPDGKRLGSVGQDGSIRLWSLANGEPLIHTYCPTRSPCLTIGFHPSNRWFAAAGKDRVIQIYDVVDKDPETLLFTTLYAHLEGVTALAFSEDGTHMASASEDSHVQVWKVDETLNKRR